MLFGHLFGQQRTHCLAGGVFEEESGIGRFKVHLNGGNARHWMERERERDEEIRNLYLQESINIIISFSCCEPKAFFVNVIISILVSIPKWHINLDANEEIYCDSITQLNWMAVQQRSKTNREEDCEIYEIYCGVVKHLLNALRWFLLLLQLLVSSLAFTTVERMPSHSQTQVE